MAYEQVTHKLPDIEVGTNRYFAAKHNNHGDVAVTTWADTDPNAKNIHSFCMRDGAEVTFSAALMGYYARLGINTKDQTKLLRAAIKATAHEPSYLKPLNEDYDADELVRCATGYYSDLYEEPPLGLDPLVKPISAGTRQYEIIGGTGIYTKLEELGRLMLVLTYIRPPKNTVIDTVSFCQTDIPVLAKTMAELSMGACELALNELYHKVLG